MAIKFIFGAVLAFTAMAAAAPAADATETKNMWGHQAPGIHSLYPSSKMPWYSGPSSSFPHMSEWKSFDEIFNINKGEMKQTGDTDEDIGRIWNAVVKCARDIGVEERVIFSIIMQESAGNVGAETTNGGAAGLMQVVGGPAFPGRHGLSQDDITSMVRAGTEHFKGNLKQFGNADNADTIYKALRVYNSGSINESNLSDGRGATDSYVSDLANRLCGR